MKKLYRSASNKMLAGVCAGVAEYFNIDPTVIRVISFVSVINIPLPWGKIKV